MTSSPSPFPHYQSQPDEQRGDWVSLTRKLWNGRTTLIVSVLVGMSIGVALALLSKPSYTATAILVPQTTTSATSQLSGLASLAGINVNLAQASELSPVVYPRLANSLRFKLEVMYTPYRFKKYDEPVSLYEYYTREKPVAGEFAPAAPGDSTSVSAESRLSLSSTEPAALTVAEAKVKRILDKNIFLSLDKKDGLLTLKVTLPEAEAAAQVAQKVQDMLQRDIIRLQTGKAQAELDFIQERYDAVKAEAESYQAALAAGSDQFKELVSSVPKISNTRLQTRYNIANSVFQEMAKQLEQAKIQVKKDTPVFTVVEPVSVPYQKDGQGRVVLVLVFTMLGAIVGVVLIMLKQNLQSIRDRWRKAGGE